MCVACHMCASDRNVIIPTPPTQPFPCVNVCKNSEFHRVVNDAGSKNIPMFLLETNPPCLSMDLAYLPTFYLHLLFKKTYIYLCLPQICHGYYGNSTISWFETSFSWPWITKKISLAGCRWRVSFSVRGKHTFRPSSLGAKWFRFRVSIYHPLGFKEGTLWKPAGREVPCFLRQLDRCLLGEFSSGWKLTNSNGWNFQVPAFCTKAGGNTLTTFPKKKGGFLVTYLFSHLRLTASCPTKKST